MKEYFYRITHEAKKWELVYWWIVRATMFYAMIDAAVQGDIQQVLQTLANTAGMFAWEIFMIFSPKRFPRHIPSYLQDFMIALLWLGSFGGAYINLYYKSNAYDFVMHAVLGGFAVIIGYELVAAMQKRDKKPTHIGIALVAAFGFSFIVGTGWELFEFTFDQVAGGDSQHWSRELAAWASREYNNPALADPYLFNPASYAPRLTAETGEAIYNSVEEIFISRYAVIDTMEDIVFNTLGAVAVYIGLRIRPYYHRGANNLNAQFKDSKDTNRKSKIKA